MCIILDMGSAIGGPGGPWTPQFLEKINEFLKVTIDFLIILTLWTPSFKPVADFMILEDLLWKLKFEKWISIKFLNIVLRSGPKTDRVTSSTEQC